MGEQPDSKPTSSATDASSADGGVGHRLATDLRSIAGQCQNYHIPLSSWVFTPSLATGMQLDQLLDRYGLLLPGAPAGPAALMNRVADYSDIGTASGRAFAKPDEAAHISQLAQDASSVVVAAAQGRLDAVAQKGREMLGNKTEMQAGSDIGQILQHDVLPATDLFTMVVGMPVTRTAGAAAADASAATKALEGEQAAFQRFNRIPELIAQGKKDAADAQGQLSVASERLTQVEQDAGAIQKTFNHAITAQEKAGANYAHRDGLAQIPVDQTGLSAPCFMAAIQTSTGMSGGVHLPIPNFLNLLPAEQRQVVERIGIFMQDAYAIVKQAGVDVRAEQAPASWTEVHSLMLDMAAEGRTGVVGFTAPYRATPDSAGEFTRVWADNYQTPLGEQRLLQMGVPRSDLARVAQDATATMNNFHQQILSGTDLATIRQQISQTASGSRGQQEAVRELLGFLDHPDQYRWGHAVACYADSAGDIKWVNNTSITHGTLEDLLGVYGLQRHEATPSEQLWGIKNPDFAGPNTLSGLRGAYENEAKALADRLSSAQADYARATAESQAAEAKLAQLKADAGERDPVAARIAELETEAREARAAADAALATAQQVQGARAGLEGMWRAQIQMAGLEGITIQAATAVSPGSDLTSPPSDHAPSSDVGAPSSVLLKGSAQYSDYSGPGPEAPASGAAGEGKAGPHSVGEHGSGHQSTGTADTSSTTPVDAAQPSSTTPPQQAEAQATDIPPPDQPPAPSSDLPPAPDPVPDPALTIHGPLPDSVPAENGLGSTDIPPPDEPSAPSSDLPPAPDPVPDPALTIHGPLPDSVPAENGLGSTDNGSWRSGLNVPADPAASTSDPTNQATLGATDWLAPMAEDSALFTEPGSDADTNQKPSGGPGMIDDKGNAFGTAARDAPAVTDPPREAITQADPSTAITDGPIADATAGDNAATDGARATDPAISDNGTTSSASDLTAPSDTNQEPSAGAAMIDDQGNAFGSAATDAPPVTDSTDQSGESMSQTDRSTSVADAPIADATDGSSDATDGARATDLAISDDGSTSPAGEPVAPRDTNQDFSGGAGMVDDQGNAFGTATDAIDQDAASATDNVDQTGPEDAVSSTEDTDHGGDTSTDATDDAVQASDAGANQVTGESTDSSAPTEAADGSAAGAVADTGEPSGAGMSDDQGNAFEALAKPGDGGWTSGMSIGGEDPTASQDAGPTGGDSNTTVELSTEAHIISGASSDSGSAQNDTTGPESNSSLDEIDVDPLTGQPYTVDSATGQTQSIQASGVDSSGNPIYQAPVQAGGDTFEVDSSGSTVATLGPIDQSGWVSSPSEDDSSVTSGQESWSGNDTATNDWTGSSGGTDSSSGSTDPGYSSGDSGGTYSSGDSGSGGDSGYSGGDSYSSSDSSSSDNSSSGASEGAPVEESAPPPPVESGGEG